MKVKRICPQCQDFTQQKVLGELPSEIKNNKYNVQLTIELSLCLECDEIIDHENIQLKTPEWELVPMYASF